MSTCGVSPSNIARIMANILKDKHPENPDDVKKITESHIRWIIAKEKKLCDQMMNLDHSWSEAKKLLHKLNTYVLCNNNFHITFVNLIYTCFINFHHFFIFYL